MFMLSHIEMGEPEVSEFDISARDVCEILAIRGKYTTWFNSQIKRLELVEGTHFIKTSSYVFTYSKFGYVCKYEHFLTYEAAVYVISNSGRSRNFYARQFYLDKLDYFE